MNHRFFFSAIVALVLISAVAASANEAGEPAGTAPDAKAAFERLKQLEGEWDGTTRRGNSATLTYRVIAGGNTLMEEFSEMLGERELSMHTLYHLDGDSLMLTHYCVSNNQPRMRADLTGLPDVLRFEFVDGTNLGGPGDGRMHRAVIELKGDDRMVNAWTYRKDGEDQYTETIEWQRRAGRTAENTGGAGQPTDTGAAGQPANTGGAGQPKNR